MGGREGGREWTEGEATKEQNRIEEGQGNDRCIMVAMHVEQARIRSFAFMAAITSASCLTTSRAAFSWLQLPLPLIDHYGFGAPRVHTKMLK